MNTTKTRKNNTRTNSPAHVDEIAEIKAEISTIAEALATIMHAIKNTPALEAPQAPVIPAKKSARVKAPKAKADDAKTVAYRARVESIKAAKEQGASRAYPQALALVAKQIVHNRTLALQADPKATHLNAKIFEASPASLRVWLRPAEHQAYKASRDANGIAPTDSDSNIAKAVAKLARK